MQESQFSPQRTNKVYLKNEDSLLRHSPIEKLEKVKKLRDDGVVEVKKYVPKKQYIGVLGKKDNKKYLI